MQDQIYYSWMQFVTESFITARFYMLSPIRDLKRANPLF